MVLALGKFEVLARGKVCGACIGQGLEMLV